MYSIRNLSCAVSGRTLFSDVHLTLTPESRYALIGANGSGKSTFLKILTGHFTDYSGSVQVEKNKVEGYLEQFTDRWSSYTCVDLVLSADPHLRTAVAQKMEALNRNDKSLLQEAETELAQNGYHARVYEAEIILSGLGLESEKHHFTMSNLSGGMGIRVMLARALFRSPDFLLLDEPTNYLDFPSIEWLSRFLSEEYKRGFLISSHNRDFLQRISNGVLDVDYGKITCYKGSYDQFEERKKEMIAQKEAERTAILKERERIQAFVNRFKAKAGKARQAQSRQKQIERMVLPEVPQSSRQSPGFAFEIKEKSFHKVLEFENLKIRRGEKIVIEEASARIYRGDKVALVGANGAGKTSLFLGLLNQLPLESGTLTIGKRVHIGFLTQDLKEVGGSEETVYQWLFSHASVESAPDVTGVLGRLLFSQEEMNKKTSVLSGGEKARLAIARIMLEKPNVLFLDEPTNHLDLEAIIALENALRDYEGTVVLISHDRRFLQRTVNRVFYLAHGVLTEKQNLLELESEALSTEDAKKEAPAESANKVRYLQKKERKKETERLKRRHEALTARMKEIETKSESLHEKMTGNESASFSADQWRSLQHEKGLLEAEFENVFTELDEIEKQLFELEKMKEGVSYG